jgi:hypothetical protein
LIGIRFGFAGDNVCICVCACILDVCILCTGVDVVRCSCLALAIGDDFGIVLGSLTGAACADEDLPIFDEDTICDEGLVMFVVFVAFEVMPFTVEHLDGSRGIVPFGVFICNGTDGVDGFDRRGLLVVFPVTAGLIFIGWGA